MATPDMASILIVLIVLAGATFALAPAAHQSWADPTYQQRNELVFAERNKAYGAYALRQHHDRRLAIALLLTFTGLGAALVGARAWVHSLPTSGTVDIGRPITAIDVIFDATFALPEGEPRPQQHTAPPTTKQQRRPQEEADGNLLVEPGIRDIDTLTGAEADEGLLSTERGDAEPTGGDPDGWHPDNPGTSTGASGGTGSGTANRSTIDTVLPGYLVETPPRFPGGEAAMKRWVDRNLRVPQSTVGREQVYIQFTVDREGMVGDVIGVEGNDRALIEAAERTVRRMPRWEPATVGHQKVRCRLVLPIQVETR